MNLLCDDFCITARTELADGVFDYCIACAPICAQAVPGQFVHIKIQDDAFLLRRPISICGVDRAKGELRLVLEARGEGTRRLAMLNVGDTMNVLGPCGNGFTLLPRTTRSVVVGGGIGTPPLLALAEYYGEGCTALLGFRSSGNVILDTDFAMCCDTVICTDDGSWGVEGTVAPALEALLQAARLDIIYACGPRGMLRAVQELALRYGVRCQLSLEERMACGVGACLGCAVTLERGGVRVVERVCKEGPVFEGAEVCMLI